MSNDDKGCVILTHGRSLQALAAASSLGRRGVRVIGCDEAPMTVLSFSKHVAETFTHAALRDEDAYIESMREAIEARRPEADTPYVLMPMHSEMGTLARHRDRLEDVIELAAPAAETIDRVFPKDALIRTAEKVGVPIPRSVVIDDSTEVDEVLGDVEFPALVKPAAGSGGRGIEKVADADALRRVLDQRSDGQTLIVQALAPGEDYCVTGLYDHGERVATMAYKNLRTFPSEAGFGVVRQTVEAEPCVEVADELMRALAWHGVAEVDFRWDAEARGDGGDGGGEPKLIEVNPRFWSGLFQSIASGVDFPWLLYRLTAYEEAEAEGEPKIGTKTKIPLLPLLSAIDEVTEDRGRMDELSEKGAEALETMKGGDFWAAMQMFGAALQEAMDVDDRFEAMRRAMDTSDEAISELTTQEDPATPLGVLYVLASLLKHGSLPDELKR